MNFRVIISYSILQPFDYLCILGTLRAVHALRTIVFRGKIRESLGVEVYAGSGRVSCSSQVAPTRECIPCFRSLNRFRLLRRRGVSFSYNSEQLDRSESEKPESRLLRSWLKGLHDRFIGAATFSSSSFSSSFMSIVTLKTYYRL